MGILIDVIKVEVVWCIIVEKENSFIFVGDFKVNYKGVVNVEGI